MVSRDTMRRVVVWANGRGWAEDGSIVLFELPAMRLEIWGPHDVYFFRNICRIMERSMSISELCGQHFAWEICDEIWFRSPQRKRRFGGFLVLGKETSFFLLVSTHYYYYD